MSSEHHGFINVPRLASLRLNASSPTSTIGKITDRVPESIEPQASSSSNEKPEVTSAEKPRRHKPRFHCGYQGILAASVGVNPSTAVAQGTSGTLPDPNDHVKIQFNNIYVNQEERGVAPYDATKFGYVILDKGIYSVGLNINVFMLSLLAEGGTLPITLTNLGRYTVAVWKQDKDGVVTQLAAENSVFSRMQSVAAEQGLNDVNNNDIQFFISTDNSKPHYVDVGDLIYATVKLNTAPTGNISQYRCSVLSAGREDDQTISGSFFNIQRISKL